MDSDNVTMPSRRGNTKSYTLDRLADHMRGGTMAQSSNALLADNLTSKQAYKLEYRHLEEMVYVGKREQLWNGVPHTINTPEEREAYVSKLVQRSSFDRN